MKKQWSEREKDVVVGFIILCVGVWGLTVDYMFVDGALLPEFDVLGLQPVFQPRNEEGKPAVVRIDDMRVVSGVWMFFVLFGLVVFVIRMCGFRSRVKLQDVIRRRLGR